MESELEREGERYEEQDKKEGGRGEEGRKRQRSHKLSNFLAAVICSFMREVQLLFEYLQRLLLAL